MAGGWLAYRCDLAGQALVIVQSVDPGNGLTEILEWIGTPVPITEGSIAGADRLALA